MSSGPAVSVCVPTYNSARWLRETLESVRAQTFSDHELVVCDNQSTDETPEIVAAFRDARFVRNDANLGQAGNWNRCVGEARGDYVVILHSDDLLEPRFLEEMVALARAHPDTGLFHCAVTIVDAGGERLGRSETWPSDRVDAPGPLLEKLLTLGCVVNPAGVMVPRRVYEAVGAFRKDVVWGVDWDMWTRIAMRWSTAYAATPLARYREHPMSGTSRLSAADNAVDELKVLRSLIADLPASLGTVSSRRRTFEDGVAHRTWCFAELHALAGDARRARRGLVAAARIRPSLALEPRSWALWVLAGRPYRRWLALRGRATSDRPVTYT